MNRKKIIWNFLNINLQYITLIYNLKNLVKQKTRYKDPDNPSWIDLILTDCHRRFQNTNVFETGLSDFQKMTVSVLKSYIPTLKLNSAIAHLEMNLIMNYDFYNIEYQHFLNSFLEILNKHFLIKKKCIRANQSSFMTRELSKAIIKRSRLCNTSFL